MSVRIAEALFNFPRLYRAKFAITGAVVATLKPILFGKSFFTLDDLLASEAVGAANVLEIGSGDGENLRLLHARGFKGRYAGIDVNQNMIAHCRSEYPEEQWVQVTRPPYDFPDQSFDVVLIVNVLHHLDDHDAILAMLREAMRIGKRLVLFEPLQSEFPWMIWIKRLYWAVTDGGNLYFRERDFAEAFRQIGAGVITQTRTAPLRQFFAATLARKSV